MTTPLETAGVEFTAPQFEAPDLRAIRDADG